MDKTSIKGIIVDDDSTVRILLEEYLKLQDHVELLNIFDNSMDALRYLNEHEVDYVFLDIHMPTLTGIDIVKSLKNPPMIVMVTSDSDFAIDAFNYPFIVDYLLKPISYARFLKAINKLKGSISNRKNEHNVNVPDNLYIPHDGSIIKIIFDEIEYLEANGDYVNIVTKDKKHIIHSTFKNIRVKLPESMFYQTHRSFIVNLNKVKEIRGNAIMFHRIPVPISKTYKNGLLERLNLL